MSLACSPSCMWQLFIRNCRFRSWTKKIFRLQGRITAYTCGVWTLCAHLQAVYRTCAYLRCSALLGPLGSWAWGNSFASDTIIAHLPFLSGLTWFLYLHNNADLHLNKLMLGSVTPCSENTLVVTHSVTQLRNSHAVPCPKSEHSCLYQT